MKFINFLFFLSAAIFLNSCSSDDFFEEPVKNYKLNFSNNSYGCAQLTISDSSGIVMATHLNDFGRLDTNFNSRDSIFQIHVQTFSSDDGVACIIRDGEYNYLAPQEFPGSGTMDTQINIGSSNKLMVDVLFYPLCPFPPDGPGCVTPPFFPVTCD